jgi:hypothetical protein
VSVVMLMLQHGWPYDLVMSGCSDCVVYCTAF